MQKKSLLTILSVSAVTILIIVIVLMGTFNIAVLVEDIDEADVLFDSYNKTFESSLQVGFDRLENAPDNNRISFHKMVDRSLSITINYINNRVESFSDGDLDVYQVFIELLDIIPSHADDDYFIVNDAGDIILDESGCLSGNLLEIVDDSNNLLFDPNTKLEAFNDKKFSSTWIKNNEKHIYYASIKKLNDDYYIGIMTNRDEAIAIYKNMYIEQFEAVSSLDSAAYVIYTLNGEKVMGEFDISESTLKAYIEEQRVGQLNYNEHERLGILYYQVFPELDWVVIQREVQLNQLYLLTRVEGQAREKQLNWMYHLIFTLIIGVFISFALISKSVRKKVDTQINTLNNSYKNQKLIVDDDILFDEFGRVVHVFNQITKLKTSSSKIIERPIKDDYNKDYLIKTIKNFLVDTYVDRASEEFDLKELLIKSLEKMKIETSDFNVDIICDQEIVMFQNKMLIKGIMRFFISNLIMNTGHLLNNTITIEIFSDDKEVHISFTRNIIKKYESHSDIIYNIFEELDEEILSNLNGRLDYSNYEQPDRKLVIHCPLVK